MILHQLHPGSCQPPVLPFLTAENATRRHSIHHCYRDAASVALICDHFFPVQEHRQDRQSDKRKKERTGPLI